MKLLLVEDEEKLSALVARGLKKWGYAVDTAYDGEEALYMHSINQYDLVILDLNLPKIDGLAVLREIRKTDKTTRVLVLSARSHITHRVEGLDNGANDYLVKPFDFMELEARIRALLRVSFVQQDNILQLQELSLDRVGRFAVFAGTRLCLTPKEYGILEYLMVNRGKIISGEELFEHIWDSEADMFSNTLKYHIHSLKKKLLGGAEYIKNYRGMGYVMGDNNEIVE